MQVEEKDRGIGVQGGWYRLEIAADDPLWAELEVEGEPFARLFVASSVDPPDGADIVGPPAGWRVEHADGNPADGNPDSAPVMLTAEGPSSVWQRKRYVFECADDWLAYSVEVEGEGSIDSLRLFEGLLEGTLDGYIGEPAELVKDPPSGRTLKQWLTGSMAGFDEVFVPDPVGSFRQWIPSFEPAAISVDGERPDAGGAWFFTPPPLCYCMRLGDRWVAAGIAATPGEANFVHYEYTGGELFGLRLTYHGYTRVAGQWRSPKLVFVPGDDEYDALARYVAWLREQGYVSVPERRVPAWWRQPIICGWGEQCWHMSQSGNRPHIYATETAYRRLLDVARANRIPFGTLIIDDKWQARYGLNRPDTGKWPDMRAFIDEMAADGVHVLLWYNSWGCEGVPEDECIMNDGKPLVVDPTNPAYEKRLREQVHTMLSSDEGCLNAWGFKIDFTADVPKEPGCRVHEDGVWGIELLKRLMSIIYSAAKAAKPEALIITQTANPYFADTTDMLRLNDVCSDFTSVVATMQHRQKVALGACPEWLIDCDNFPLSHLPAWREYVEHQPELGVPSLYYLTSLHAEGTEFGEADYELVRRVFGAYVQGLQGDPV